MVMHIFIVLLTELLSLPYSINHLQVWIKAKDLLNTNMRDMWQREIIFTFWHVPSYVYIVLETLCKTSMLILTMNFCNILKCLY